MKSSAISPVDFFRSSFCQSRAQRGLTRTPPPSAHGPVFCGCHQGFPLDIPPYILSGVSAENLRRFRYDFFCRFRQEFPLNIPPGFSKYFPRISLDDFLEILTRIPFMGVSGIYFELLIYFLFFEKFLRKLIQGLLQKLREKCW